MTADAVSGLIIAFCVLAAITPAAAQTGPRLEHRPTTRPDLDVDTLRVHEKDREPAGHHYP